MEEVSSSLRTEGVVEAALRQLMRRAMQSKLVVNELNSEAVKERKAKERK